MTVRSQFMLFAVSFSLFLGFAVFVCGGMFGTGITALLLMHEMGHYLEVKRRKLTAHLPVFLPGLGAFVRWHAPELLPETRAAISIAGPIVGLSLTAIFAGIWFVTGSIVSAQLAREGLRLNALNLVPLWILDGRQAVAGLNTLQRLILLLAALCFWYVLGEKLLLLIAVGTLWRVIADRPTRSSGSTLFALLATLAVLALLMWVVPNHDYYQFITPSSHLVLVSLGVAWLVILGANLLLMRISGKKGIA